MSKAIPVTVLSPAIINTVSPCSPLAAAAVVEEVRGSLTSRRRAISSQAPIVRILGDRILTRRRGQTFWRVASTGEKIGPVGVVYHILICGSVTFTFCLLLPPVWICIFGFGSPIVRRFL